MTMAEEIYARALELYGEGAEEGLRGLLSLCAPAEAELAAALREETKPEDCGDTFITAGAMIALDAYGAVKAADGVTAFRAGEFSYTKGGKGGGLRERAYIMMRPWCAAPEGFAFTGACG